MRGRQQLGREVLVPIRDYEPAIQMGMHVDAQAGIGPASGTRTELEEAPVQLHRVVVLHRAPVLEAADAVEVRRRRAPSGHRMSRGQGEAGVVAGEKSIEDALRVRQRAGLGKAQLDHEAILEGAEEPLDAAFSLRRPGGDPANAEFVQGAADLGGLGPASELFAQGQGGAWIAVKDAVAIRVGGGGEAIPADQLAEQEEVAVGLFLEAEDAAEYVSGSIVDGGVKYEAGATVLEPGMVTAVHLDEEAGLRHALAAAAMAGRATGAGTADARRAEEALHRPPGEAQALVFGEQLGEMMIIHASVAGAGEREDLGPHRFREAPGRGPAPVAMGQRRDSLRAYCSQEPADVPERQAHERRGGLSGEGPGLEAGKDMGALLLLFGQGNRLPVHSPRVTNSLTR